MKPLYLTFIFLLLLAANTFAQSSATITDLTSGLPVENATVELDGNFLSTDASGMVVFADSVNNTTYDYFVSAACCVSGSASIPIDGADDEATFALEPATSNTVFFFIGSPLAIVGATVNLTDGADYNETMVTTSTFDGDVIENVPF